MPNSWITIEETILYQVFWGIEKGIIYKDEINKNQPAYWKNIRMDKIFLKTNTGSFKKDEIIREYGIYVDRKSVV